MVTVVLASASPRRAELLREAGIEFEVAPAGLDEEVEPGRDPVEAARALALAKAAAAARRLRAGLVLGADTIVIDPGDGRPLMKPRDERDARRMLVDRLASRRHEVVTGVALVDAASGAAVVGSDLSEVLFRDAAACERYLATGLWRGKAGGYGVQDEPTPVASVRGSRSNVVGLPLELLRTLLLAVAVGAAAAATVPGCDGEPQVDPRSKAGARAPDGRQEPPPAKLPAIDLRVKGTTIRVEVARHPDTRGRGLMGRRELAEMDGMLFVYEEADFLDFWMESTPLPLSNAFVAEDGRITQIEDMRPFDRSSVYSHEKVPYALEVNLGWFKLHGVTPGDRIEGLDQPAVKGTEPR